MHKRDISKQLEIIEELKQTPMPWWTGTELSHFNNGIRMTAIIDDTEYTAYCPGRLGRPCIIGFGESTFALSCFMMYDKPYAADRLWNEGGQMWPAGDLGSIRVCPITSQIIRYDWLDCVEREIIHAAHVSFSVAVWADRITKISTYPYAFIIDGTLYTCNADGIANSRGPRSSDSCRGFGGRTFKIARGDENFVIDDLWCGGNVPAFAKKYLPDNAQFSIN